LRRAVVRVKPRLHVFGHVHSGYGVRHTKNTLFVNAAMMGPLGSLDHQPIVLNLHEPGTVDGINQSRTT
jgi:Icc-related predicted phosphoesterase